MVVKTALYGDIESRNRPSFYATPVAWAVASFTRELIDEDGAIVPQHTGMIVVSDECSSMTLRELARTLATGSISPLRFAGASPSIVVGLPAIELGIRGPTVALTMPPEHASSAIVALVRYWMKYNDIVAGILIAHFGQGEGGHRFNGWIARSCGAELQHCVTQICQNDEAKERRV